MNKVLCTGTESKTPYGDGPSTDDRPACACGIQNLIITMSSSTDDVRVNSAVESRRSLSTSRNRDYNITIVSKTDHAEYIQQGWRVFNNERSNRSSLDRFIYKRQYRRTNLMTVVLQVLQDRWNKSALFLMLNLTEWMLPIIFIFMHSPPRHKSAKGIVLGLSVRRITVRSFVRGQILLPRYLTNALNSLDLKNWQEIFTAPILINWLDSGSQKSKVKVTCSWLSSWRTHPRIWVSKYLLFACSSSFVRQWIGVAIPV